MMNNKEFILYAPVDGELITLRELEDEAFSKKYLGEGFAIKPSNGHIFSPVIGTLKKVYPTKHAITYQEENLTILLHMGINTVELNGKFFRTLPDGKQSVTNNSKMSEMLLDKISSAGYNTSVVVTILETNDKIKSFELIASGFVQHGDPVAKIILEPSHSF